MSFKDDLKAAQKKLNKKLEVIRNSVIIEVFEKLVNDSPYGDPSLWKSAPPKDYHPGHFRANWRASVRNPATSELPSTTFIPNAEHIKNATIGETVYIVNNAPYAQRLEEGWSTQRPSGWIRSIMMMGDMLVTKLAKEVEGK